MVFVPHEVVISRAFLSALLCVPKTSDYRIFAERTDDVAESARRARDDAESCAKLDSGPRGLFFSAMSSVCLFAGACTA